MKGIIVDRKGRYAVVLTGDGSFIKIHNKADYRPGYEIEFEKPNQLQTGLLAKISSIAAVFLFTLGLSYGVYSYTVPYSYVDFDINPSIELTANIYDIIIKTETFNEDGEKLLESHKLNFKKLDAGIAELVDSAIEQGYLKAQTENAVLLTIASKDESKKEKLEKHMEDAALKALDEGKVDSDVVSQQVSSQKHDAAKDMGISPGKLTLIEKALTAEPELKLEDLKGASVKTIMKHINENRKDEKKEEKQDKNSDKQEARQEQKQDEEDKNQVTGDRKQDSETEQDKEEQDKEEQDKEEQDKGNKQDKDNKEEKDNKEDKGNKKDQGNKQDQEDNQKDNQTVNSKDQANEQDDEDKGKDSAEENGEKSDKKDQKPDNKGSDKQNSKKKD